MSKNAFYSQSGGVTSVINTTASAVILEAKKSKKINKVFAGKNGILGALNEELYDTSVESTSFIKDLKFSIPNPKTFFLISKDISNYKINIEIKSAQVKEKIIEVNTTLSLKPIKNDFELIDTKITYSAIVEIDKDINDKKIIQNIVLIKVPTEIYTDLRKIFVFVFEQSGFKNIKINEKVDFQKLYNLRKVQ